MDITSEDFEPRRDGWFEHKGTWGEVTVGTVIASGKRSERWEIIEVAMAIPVEHGRTLWMRAREQATGAEYTVPPRYKHRPVTILTQDPQDTETAPPTPPVDAEAIMLLVEKLGATHLASRDHETGEVTCPELLGTGTDPFEHLRLAHGIEDLADVAAEPHDDMMTSLIHLHSAAHDPIKGAQINQGGFAHRHVPEDLSIFTGVTR